LLTGVAETKLALTGSKAAPDLVAKKAKATFIGKVCGCEGEGDDPGSLRYLVASDFQV
jgi:hypothetical protein